MASSFAGAAWQVAGILALVFANGFFVAAEFSIVTVRKTRVDQLVAEGHVAWSDRRVGMGIQFEIVDPANQGVIDQFVDAHFFSNRKA